jgi:hypothetical protein
MCEYVCETVRKKERVSEREKEEGENLRPGRWQFEFALLEAQQSSTVTFQWY